MKTEAEAISIENFPLEIIDEIFARLQFSDQKNARLVCKYFSYSCSKDYWKLVLTNFYTSTLLQFIPPNSCLLPSQSLEELDGDENQFLSQITKRIQKDWRRDIEMQIFFMKVSDKQEPKNMDDLKKFCYFMCHHIYAEKQRHHHSLVGYQYKTFKQPLKEKFFSALLNDLHSLENFMETMRDVKHQITAVSLKSIHKNGSRHFFHQLQVKIKTFSELIKKFERVIVQTYFLSLCHDNMLAKCFVPTKLIMRSTDLSCYITPEIFLLSCCLPPDCFDCWSEIRWYGIERSLLPYTVSQLNILKTCHEGLFELYLSAAEDHLITLSKEHHNESDLRNTTVPDPDNLLAIETKHPIFLKSQHSVELALNAGTRETGFYTFVSKEMLDEVFQIKSYPCDRNGLYSAISAFLKESALELWQFVVKDITENQAAFASFFLSEEVLEAYLLSNLSEPVSLSVLQELTIVAQAINRRIVLLDSQYKVINIEAVKQGTDAPLFICRDERKQLYHGLRAWKSELPEPLLNYKSFFRQDMSNAEVALKWLICVTKKTPINYQKTHASYLLYPLFQGGNPNEFPGITEKILVKAALLDFELAAPILTRWLCKIKHTKSLWVILVQYAFNVHTLLFHYHLKLADLLDEKKIASLRSLYDGGEKRLRIRQFIDNNVVLTQRLNTLEFVDLLFSSHANQRDLYLMIILCHIFLHDKLLYSQHYAVNRVSLFLLEPDIKTRTYFYQRFSFYNQNTNLDFLLKLIAYESCDEDVIVLFFSDVSKFSLFREDSRFNLLDKIAFFHDRGLLSLLKVTPIKSFSSWLPLKQWIKLYATLVKRNFSLFMLLQKPVFNEVLRYYLFTADEESIYQYLKAALLQQHLSTTFIEDFLFILASQYQPLLINLLAEKEILTVYPSLVKFALEKMHEKSSVLLFKTCLEGYFAKITKEQSDCLGLGPTLYSLYAPKPKVVAPDLVKVATPSQSDCGENVLPLEEPTAVHPEQPPDSNAQFDATLPQPTCNKVKVSRNEYEIKTSSLVMPSSMDNSPINLSKKQPNKTSTNFVPYSCFCLAFVVGALAIALGILCGLHIVLIGGSLFATYSLVGALSVVSVASLGTGLHLYHQSKPTCSSSTLYRPTEETCVSQSGSQENTPLLFQAGDLLRVNAMDREKEDVDEKLGEGADMHLRKRGH